MGVPVVGEPLAGSGEVGGVVPVVVPDVEAIDKDM